MKRKLTIILLLPIVISAFWFLGVDGSWFVENCPDCQFSRDVFQYRVFTLAISEQARTHDSIPQKIAEDIGVSCQHPKLERWHKHRYWGLLICAHPCINGILGMGDGVGWYDEKARLTVREMAKTDPTLRDEFAERVFKKHDWAYLKNFCIRVRALRDGTPAISP